MVYTVVLTGGIASGKTAVSDRFAERGVPVIDTDRIAREVVEPGQPALARVVQTFGEECLDTEGRLDRKRMRERVFSDPEQRKELEAILHPAIADEVTRRIADLNSGYCILVIPLFARSRAYDWVDRVLVVDVDEETQISRVMARDSISQDQALAVLGAQSTRAERLALADDVIVNNGTLNDLASQVEQLHRKYQRLAG
jgi:dephospho-CoA kinase